MQKQKEQIQPKNEQKQNQQSQKILEQAAQMLHNALNVAAKHGAYDLKESSEIFQAMGIVYEAVAKEEIK